MRVETNEIEYCKIHVTYKADSETVSEKIEKAVRQLRNAAIPGFRPGKAPDAVIKLKCKQQIHSYVLGEMLEQAYEDIKFKTKMKPIGQPKVTDADLKGTTFSCEIDVNKAPDFELAEYKGFEIPKPIVSVTVDEDVQKGLQELRISFGDVFPYGEDDFVEMGDQVTLDFAGTIEGEPFKGSTAEGDLYLLGENRFPGFDDNILGMAPDEEREFSIDLPTDSLDKLIAGKSVNFKVKVHMGMKKKPCPLDDELAKKCGMESLAEVKEKLHQIAEMRIKNSENNLMRQQVAKRLVERHDFKAPEWLITQEGQHLAMQSNLDWDALSDEEKEILLKSSEENVKISLILDSIREEEPEAVLSEAEAISGLKQRAAAQGKDPEQFVVESQKNGSLFGLVAALKDEFTMQWLVKQAKVIE